MNVEIPDPMFVPHLRRLTWDSDRGGYAYEFTVTVAGIPIFQQVVTSFYNANDPEDYPSDRDAWESILQDGLREFATELRRAFQFHERNGS